MPETASTPDLHEIEKWLRDALNHLYDIGYLDNHPLASLLVRADEVTGRRGQDLRKVLIAAIQARKPPRGTPRQSPDWRAYQILEQHILAGLSPAEAMQKLNISRSLFFLEKTRILKSLFDDLYTERIAGAVSAEPPPLVFQPAHSENETDAAVQLLEGAVLGPVDLASVLQSTRPLIESLARTQGTQVEIDPRGCPSVPHAERVLLRQVILSLSSELIQLVPGGQMRLGAYRAAGWAGILVEAHSAPADPLILRLEERRGISPTTAGQLLAAMQGELQVDISPEGAYRAVLRWPQMGTAQSVLLVDDHPDISSLFTRYLSGTGWEVLWAPSAERARQMLAGQRPSVIVLDVILPQEDGWEFLIALKGDPQTRDLPVVVCSAIHEPDLIRSLGAQGYLPKPFSAAQLVQALSTWAK